MLINTEPVTINSHYKITIRNLRTALTLGDMSIDVDVDQYKKFKKTKEYKTYIKNYKGKAITGSLALKLFGLLDREIGDMDIIDPSITNFEFTHQDHYTFTTLDEGYLGSMKHGIGPFSMFGEFYVDIFNDNNVDKIIYEDIVLDNPLSILEVKIRMTDNSKHVYDIIDILNRIDIMLSNIPMIS